MAIEFKVNGLDKLEATNDEMIKWAKRPFNGKSALRIRHKFTEMNKQAFNTKGQSIGENWPSLSPIYSAWKSRNYPKRPMLVLKGDLKASVTKPTSRNLIFNRGGGKMLTLGSRVPYANAHNYGNKKLPKRTFIKMTQKTAEVFTAEMTRDLIVAMNGSDKWQG